MLAKLLQYLLKGFLFLAFVLDLYSAAVFVPGAVMQKLDNINGKTKMINKKTKKRL